MTLETICWGKKFYLAFNRFLKLTIGEWSAALCGPKSRRKPNAIAAGTYLKANKKIQKISHEEILKKNR